ncbi:MAG: hypothetical protein QXK88_03010 [Desulfurococcaceae archaeon]
MKKLTIGDKPVHKHVGLALIILGVVFILLAVAVAYNSFYNYRLPLVSGSDLESVIISMINVLVEIAIRLGFIGIIVWAGGLLLKHGVAAIRP